MQRAAVRNDPSPVRARCHPQRSRRFDDVRSRSKARSTSKPSSSTSPNGTGRGSNGGGDGLVELYRSRLGLPPDLPLPCTLDTLELLTEAHLRRIPFENVSIHIRGGVCGGDSGCVLLSSSTSTRQPVSDTTTVAGDDGDDEEKKDEDAKPEFSTTPTPPEPPIVLDLPRLRTKILRRNRGGCCLELNGLFALLLRELGYTVRLVPCWVYAGRERGHSGGAKFRAVQTHFWLLVGGAQGGSASGRSFLVDVGLGEPPLGPLRYSPDRLCEEQITPDGMRSRIVEEEKPWTDGRGRLRRCLRLEWRRRRRRRGEADSGQARTTRADSEGSTSAVAVEARRRRIDADRLRVVAERAAKRGRARPQTAFQAYKSDPEVRDEASRRLWAHREQRRKQQGLDVRPIPPPPDASEVHREICSMWTEACGDEKLAYGERGLGEKEDLRRAAEEAMKKARRAEVAALAAEAAAAAQSREGSQPDTRDCNGNEAEEESYWEPRLQWDVTDAPLSSPGSGSDEKEEDVGPALVSFQHAASIIASDRSTFAKKVIACSLTRDAKVTLSGRTLRVTSPRFHDLKTGGARPKQTITELASTEEVRTVLEEQFGIGRDQTEGLDLRVSEAAANSRLWDHL